MGDTTKPELTLLVKLGAIAVHIDEIFDNTERGAMVEGLYHSAQHDVYALRSLLEDPDVKQWVKDMGAFLPLKRK